MNRLSGPGDEIAYREEVAAALSSLDNDDDIDDQRSSHVLLLDRIINSPDRTVAALAQVSQTLDQLPIDEKRRVEIDKSLVLLGDSLAVCDKIYTSPVPLVYTRHTARFLSLWMLLLPAALYDTFAGFHNAAAGALHALALIPTVAVVAVFLFGIDELAVQLEEPFSILPMQAFCDDVRESNKIIVEW